MQGLGDQQRLAHARAVQARGVVLPPAGLPPPEILDSWVRCMDLGLSSGAALAVPVIEASALAHRLDRAEFVRRLAQAELDTLSRQIAGSNFLLAFADSEGVILDLYADNRFRMSGSGANIVVGSSWSEAEAGTNGLGTALATGRAVAVSGLEHYFTALGQISCTAAPVRDAAGQVVGVLDASSYYESRQHHTLALVQMAAANIENGLFAHQMRGHLVLAVHPRAEFLSTLSAGLLAFDEAGQLLALNGPARSLLSGLNAVPGARFDALFAEPIDQVLARFHRQSELRLRDALGSALAARMVGRPTGRRLGMSGVVRPLPRLQRAAAAGDPTVLRASSAAPADFLNHDPAVQAACRLVEAAVRRRVPILLQGETGTGKELLARHAHRVSGRRGEFVAVNCAAMPAELFEAELFGYVGGAYSGARREGSEGLIRAADGGTLLLDEVRELPLQLQAALLRFLDDQQVRPLGGRSSVGVDVQLMAASHADLEDEVRARSFRQDLLYRLNTVPVVLPPLRLRHDLAQAVHWVLRQIEPAATISDEAVLRLTAHPWPGNFRELRSVLTRLLMAQVDQQDMPNISLAQVQAHLPPAAAVAAGSMLQRNSSELVRNEYERTGHSVSQTSRNLGISRTTVYRHLGQ